MRAERIMGVLLPRIAGAFCCLLTSLFPGGTAQAQQENEIFVEGGDEIGPDEVPIVDHEDVPPPQESPPPPQQPVRVTPPQQPPPSYTQPVAVQPRQTPSPHPQRLRRVAYRDGMTVPPGGQIVTSRRVGLIISGAVTFAVPYLITAFAYSVSEDIGGDVSGTILVPVVGPLLSIPDAGSSSGRVLLALDAAVQAAGLAMFVVGLMPRRYVEYYAGPVTLRPLAGQGSAGFDLQVRF